MSRYQSSSSRVGGGFGFVPLLLLAVIGLFVLQVYGGGIPSLHQLQSTIFR